MLCFYFIDSGQDYKRNAYMEADLQCSNAVQPMEKRLRAACNASDSKIDNVAKVILRLAANIDACRVALLK